MYSFLWNKIPLTLSVVTAWLHQECIPRSFSQIPAELIWSQPPNHISVPGKGVIPPNSVQSAVWMHNPEYVFFFFTDFSFFFLFAVPFESCYAAKQAQQIKCHVKQKQAWKLPSGCTAHLAERAARGPDYPCQWKRKWDSGFCSVTACGHTPPFQGTIISGYLDFLFRGAKTHHI